MSVSAQTPTHAPASFSSLPYELREQIWLYTLPPRMIYIHQHEVYPLLTKHVELLDEQGLEIEHDEPCKVSVLFNYSIYTQDTTPASAFAIYAKETIASLEKESNTSSDNLTRKWDLQGLQKFKFKSSGPPAALNVCRESRDLAIRKGYVLAFKPVNLENEGSEPCGKGIWVDFERDMVMFNTKLRHWLIHSRTELIEFLGVLMILLPEDAARIKRIALCGDLISTLETLGDCREEVTNGDDSEWRRFPGYPSLKEIWVDDELSVDNHEEDHTQSLTHTPRPLFTGNEQAVEEFLKARLVRNSEHAISITWPWGVPSFKVVRGETWKEYF
ncbi:hypothetical protein BKA64DRAFT_671566 [Cadophora sp. MPI-SDFR-AT-0126]|nr:hypothetical protein BKA64DRAFT_671566 [Leotiomycetes sp. MPI-SDFR-AT-0126]